MFVTVTYFWRLRLFSPDNVSKSCFTITVTSPELRVFFRLFSTLLLSWHSWHENFTDFGQSVWESVLRKTWAGFCVTYTWLQPGTSLKVSLFSFLVPPLFLSSLVRLLWSKSVWKSDGVFCLCPRLLSPSSASRLAPSLSLLSCSRPRTLEAISPLSRTLTLTTNVYIGHWLIRKISDDKHQTYFPGSVLSHFVSRSENQFIFKQTGMDYISQKLRIKSWWSFLALKVWMKIDTRLCLGTSRRQLSTMSDVTRWTCITINLWL